MPVGGLGGAIRAQLVLDTSRYTASLKQVEAKTRASAAKQAGWWKRFGAPAVGFTVAYRAMNMLEEGLKALTREAFKTLSVIGEFERQSISAAGMIATFAKTENPFETYRSILPAVKDLMIDMEIVAAKHLVTAQELRTTWEAFVMRGIVANTRRDLEGVAVISDTIRLVAERSGQSYYQMRQEVFALMRGELRRGAALFRLLVSLDPEFKKHLQNWREMGTDIEGNNIILQGTARLLAGMQAASTDLATSWEGLTATSTSMWNVIQRVGGADVYERVIKHLDNIVKGYRESGTSSKEVIAYATIWRNFLEIIYQILRSIVSLFGVAEGKASYFADLLNRIALMIRTARFGFEAIGKGLAALGLLARNVFVWIEVQIRKVFSTAAKFLSSIPVVGKLFEGWAVSSTKALGELNKELLDWDAIINTTGTDIKETYGTWLDDATKIRYETELTNHATEEQRNLLSDVAKFIKAATIGRGTGAGAAGKLAADQMRALRLQRQMLKDMGSSRRATLVQDADFELELREKTIKKLTISEGEKHELIELAEKAHKEKLKIIEGEHWEGIKKGYQQFFDELNTEYERGAEFIKGVFVDLRAGISDTFFKAMKGEFDSFEDIITSFSDKVLKRWSDMLADMVMEWLFASSKMQEGGKGKGGFDLMGILGAVLGGVAGVATGIFGGGAGAGANIGWNPMYHEGGIVGNPLASLPRLHSGLASDEYPAVLQRGETVYPKDYNFQPKESEQTNFNIFIHAVDSKSFSDIVRRNPQTITRPFMEALERGDRTLISRLRGVI